MSGDTAWVTAPRLQVAGGMRLRGRLIAADGEPWVVSLVVDEADFYSHDLARVRLPRRRGGRRRQPPAQPARPRRDDSWLAAVNCQHVVDGDRVDGTMVDLSLEGVAFATNRVLRPSDRLTFHGRFFAEQVDAEVRVTSVRESGVAGRLVVGCNFIDIDAANRGRVERLTSGESRPAPAGGSPFRRLPPARARRRGQARAGRLAAPVQAVRWGRSCARPASIRSSSPSRSSATWRPS